MAHSPTFRSRTRLRGIIIGLATVPLLATSLTLPSSAGATTNDSTQQINSQSDSQMGPVELLGAATETVRYWKYPDGRVSTEIWPRPVRVKKSGTWAWIDTTLVKQDGVVKPRVIKGELSLPGDRADAATTFTPAPGQSIELSWPTPLPAPRLEGNRATYPDAAGRGADLVVTALATGFRYDVVLRDRPSKELELEIPVRGEGVKVRKSTDGRLRVADKDNRDVALAAKPLLRGNGSIKNHSEKTGSVDTSVVTADGQQIVRLKPDQAFLADRATSYPVTIQAAFSLTPTADADVWSVGPDDSNGDGAFLKAGTESDGSKSRAYLKFDMSPLVGQQISNVTLSLLNIGGPSCGTAVGAGIQVRRVTGIWSPSTVTWSNQPGNTTENAVTNRNSIGGSCEPAAMNWDITAMARQWATDAGNYGVVLMSPTEQASANYRIFPSSEDADFNDPPKIIASFDPVGQPTTLYPAGPDGVEVISAPANWRTGHLQMAEAQAHALSNAYDRVETNGSALADPYVDMVSGQIIVPAATADGHAIGSAPLAGTAYLGLGGVDWTLPGEYTGDDSDEDAEGIAGPSEDYTFTPRISDVTNSYTTLSTITQEVVTLDTTQLPGADAIVAAGAWPERNQVLITANAVSSEMRQALAQRYGTNSIVIWLNPDATRLATHDTRNSDNDDYVNGGGRFVSNAGFQCTMGFAWNQGGERRIITAGHCLPDDGTLGSIPYGLRLVSTWKDGTGSVKLPGKSTTHGDSALVSMLNPKKPTASIFVGSATSASKRPVRRSWTRRAVPGDLYCVGGATSGQICNYEVGITEQSWPLNNPDGSFAGTINKGQKGSRLGSCSTGGDSGGPVYTIEPDGYVIAKGIYSGGKSVGPLCETIFTDIDDVRRAYGGDVMKRR
ncbi:hypothetical protein GCM10022224_041750 [Nonomuraea antimicrobica]|uniref:Carbohydrate-binding module family 96 domain-containing protein n=1 Tax=Nonomuraea antimicrobica TaxID=561173 RepID=A0ABP7C063_9ACTN